jgi:hypothetical protein
MHDENEFDLRRYFLDIDDPEERARTIHESGWGGHPDIEDIERDVARFGGGTYQGLLAALQPVKDEDDLQPVEDDLEGVAPSDGAAGGLRANGGRQSGHLDEGAA